MQLGNYMQPFKQELQDTVYQLADFILDNFPLAYFNLEDDSSEISNKENIPHITHGDLSFNIYAGPPFKELSESMF